MGQYPLPHTVLLGGIVGNFIGPFTYLNVALTERASF